MKRSKCDFFKSEIHYLGHLISPEGINPLPNKLDSIKYMPVPNSAKEIKQFLGLTGYYRKFVPRFADISRPLTTLTKKDAKFKWTSACQKSFELLKEALCGEPVLKYADTSKLYTLYTDASKYGWAGVLTQPHIMLYSWVLIVNFTANSLNVHSLFYYNYSYCKFVDILFKHLNFLFIEFSLYIGFIVLEIRS